MAQRRKGSAGRTAVPSSRAEIITRRTYNRPLDEAGLVFETWDQTVDRVIEHQKWLWTRARGKGLSHENKRELAELRELMVSRKALCSGRTLWLGGTEVARRRESSMFNCSFLRAETVYDIVDGYWLLLQGCGVGFEPVTGVLSGFTRPCKLTVIRSTKTDPNHKGHEDNVESFRPTSDLREKHHLVWTIKVGDSAEAWSKLPGKLLACKKMVKELVLDFSEIRPAGTRLKSYGWISSGDDLLCVALTAIHKLLSTRAGKLLTRMDIMDIMNHLGSTLSSRRSAEICLMPYGDREWLDFINAKKEYWINDPQRAQSNNSLVFWHKPSRAELTDLFGAMVAAGGSEPGFINGNAAHRRAPWFKGVNPCAEILLGAKSFCNLVEVDLTKFNGDPKGLLRAYHVIGRANYRQTCVDLHDGILQATWHELNEYLHLCGVGATGIVGWEGASDPARWKALKEAAWRATVGMADELGLPRPQAVTTVKPSGTLGKIMDTTEGIHKPLGRYIFNNVKFSKHDPIVAACEAAGYHVFSAPLDPDGLIVRFPVEYPDVPFDRVERDGRTLDVNLESAVTQMDRYKLLMEHYVDHNCSITVSYSPEEVPGMIDWLLENWDTYVGMSFLFRNDPTKTAADLGFPYLPQEVVDKATFDAYKKKLKPVQFVDSLVELEQEVCAGGACPIR